MEQLLEHRLLAAGARHRATRHPSRWAALAALLWLSAGMLPAAAAPRSVTFLATSDCHYDAFENEDRNARNRDTIREMNAITTRTFPAELGGGAIGRPLGVVVLGDVIDDGDRELNGKLQSRPQFEAFEKDFGLDGTDGLLKYPVFETWGNHDGPPAGQERFGFSFQAQLKRRNLLRKEKGWLAGLSENGLHYSWDWQGVHFVSLGIYPADQQNVKVHYSPKWHDPQGALAFLKRDLAERVGKSGRPVVLMSHCGFDTDWWIAEDWQAAYEAAKEYNVILYLYGHTGTGLRAWSPAASAGEERKWQCVNTGQLENGFFVVEISDGRIRLAYRIKEGVTVTKNADGTTTREWSGAWGWKWPLEKKLEQ